MIAAMAAAVLASCSAKAPTPRVPEPPALACPAALTAVPVPKPPRTWDAVLAYANETEKRRAETARRLEMCRMNLMALQQWIKEQGGGK